MPDHEGREGALHDGEYGRQGLGLGGKQETQGQGEREHELASGRFGKHVIDQVCDRLHHAPDGFERKMPGQLLSGMLSKTTKKVLYTSHTQPGNEPLVRAKGPARVRKGQ